MSIRASDLDNLIKSLPVLERQRYCDGAYFMMVPLFARDMSEAFLLTENGQKVGLLVKIDDLMLCHKLSDCSKSEVIDRFLLASPWRDFWTEVSGIIVADGESDVEHVGELAHKLSLDFVSL